MAKRWAFTVRNVEFLLGAPTVELLPESVIPEIALVGRSNVGKSSLVNRLLNRNDMARVSKEPGKTRELNLYKVLGEDRLGKKTELRIVDLPGFGFAKFSVQDRIRISTLTADYITGRPSLKTVLLLNDSKRIPEDDEREIQRLCSDAGVNLLIVLTKCDRLNRRDREAQLKLIAREYRLETTDLFQAADGESVEPLWDRIMALM